MTRKQWSNKDYPNPELEIPLGALCSTCGEIWGMHDDIYCPIDDERPLQPGYHLRPIARGEFGEVSKITEEVCELADAEAQGIKIMVLAELSDIIGAVQGYLTKHHPTITLDDLIQMAKVTQRAFESGSRKAR